MNRPEGLPDLTDRAGYPHWMTDRIRFSDTDMANHVNNVAYAAYAETGRLDLMRRHIHPLCGPGERFIAASVTVNFLRETHYPGEVEIGTRIARIGRTSMTVGQGIFKDGVCVATATGTVVFLDANGPIPLNDTILAEARKWTGG
ncbi:acyl-CoA thioesterase [Minwuia thermotolerans]|uniref:Thioesterase n=1 Tax=Minwuia thermotolerans TaxID=2056226 RepID=A0A2M9FWJ4_9PROT|nr:thioesterase family protein [Minwuia thermotolerans]PJK27840.1 thioesterase [Minwuia thermotolerans]